MTALQIGSLTFDSPLILGPLAGISCSAMRRLYWPYGKLAYSCSEMLSAHQLANQLDRSPRYTHIAANEGPVCFQLSSHNPALIAQATERAQTLGASLIDLNAGCPKPKIRRKRSGSSLLADSHHLCQLIQAMKSAASCPVTVKIRVDGHNDQYNESVLEAILQAAPDALIVHGRHWQEDYSNKPHFDQIKYFATHCPFPVIANGDVEDGLSFTRTQHATQTCGLMVSRAAIGRPWIFEKISHEAAGQTFQLPTLEQQLHLFREHLQSLSQLETSPYLAAVQARRLIRHYLKDYALPMDPMPAINQANTLDDYDRVIEQLIRASAQIPA